MWTSGLNFCAHKPNEHHRPSNKVTPSFSKLDAAMLSIGLLGFLSDRLVVLVRNMLLTWNKRETFGGQN